MSRLEKLVDRINRWWALVDRTCGALTVFGLGPWLAGIAVIVLAWLGGWAINATLIFSLFAPFSYLVAALIIAILGTLLIRAILHRRPQRIKEPRVDFWTTLEYAQLMLSSGNSRLQYDNACAERDRLAIVRSEQELARSQRMLSARAKDSSTAALLASRLDAFKDSEEEAQTRKAHQDSEYAASYWLRQMNTEIDHGLLEGTLVAKGYRGTLKEHDQVETPIPVSQWVVLKKDVKEKNVVRGDGIAYSGVQVGRTISVWQQFAIKLRRQPNSLC